MTEPTNDKILNRVRGLLDKAASTEFENEAQALRDKAMELMAAYGIEQAMLEATGRKTADTVTEIRIDFVNPFSFEKYTLASRIASALGCKTIVMKAGKSAQFVNIIGHSSNLERVEFLYTLLLVQAQNGAAKVAADPNSRECWHMTARQVGAHTRTLRASYLAGFASEIGVRLKEIARHAAAQNDATHAGDGGPGTELVLASRKEMVNRKFRELYPHTGTVKGRSYENSGYSAGQAGGRNADLGQNRFDTRGKALTR